LSEWWVGAFVAVILGLAGLSRLPAFAGVLGPMRPYAEREPLAAFFLGVSSAFPFTMIGATLTSRLAQAGIDKKSVTAFALAILIYNLKPLWAWVVEGVRLPVLGRLGQRLSWLVLAGSLAALAVLNLARVDPAAGLGETVVAALLVAFTGATYDIVIDAYRIEILRPEQLGVGAGMSQYGWRIGSVAAGATALVVAQTYGWNWGYALCAVYALPAMLVGLVLGEPTRHRPPAERRGWAEIEAAVVAPFVEFFRRRGAWLILLFILVHKIGDTLGQLTVRLLYNDLGYSNTEIAVYDVGVGFWAYLLGIFAGGALYTRAGLKPSVLLSLILMAVSNASFAGLALVGHNNVAMAGAQGFENFASGVGGVCVVAYFSALTDLRYTAAQYALISAAASVVGRIITGTTAGTLVEQFGYLNFYLFTTVVALPGVFLFWWMSRSGLVDASIGSAGAEEPGGVR
jgi:MFS transporter, PAT family, beta-lactamase induction signal transducer AmpG